MTFVKLTGEQGQDVFVNPLWVHKVEPIIGRECELWCVVHAIGGEETIVHHAATWVVGALTGEPPTVRRTRSVGEQ